MTPNPLADRATTHRSARTLMADTALRRARGTTTCPFEPTRGHSASLREWRGPRDLADFQCAVRTTTDRPETFHVRTRTARFGRFHMTDLVHSPLRFEPEADNFGHDDRTLRLVFLLEGEVELRAGDSRYGETTTLQPHGGALVVGWAPVVYASTAPAHAIVVDVPADHDTLVGLPETAPFVVGGSETALLSALAAFGLDLLQHDVDALAPAVRTQVTDSLESIVASTVTALAAPVADDWKRRAQRMHVMRYITANYADQRLSLTTIARHLGMSRRTLQRLFAGERSVPQMILAKRADQALLRLRDPRYARTSIEELAALTGFGSPLSMRRAILDRTGRTPAAIRRELAYARR